MRRAFVLLSFICSFTKCGKYFLLETKSGQTHSGGELISQPPSEYGQDYTDSSIEVLEESKSHNHSKPSNETQYTEKSDKEMAFVKRLRNIITSQQGEHGEVEDYEEEEDDDDLFDEEDEDYEENESSVEKEDIGKKRI